MIMPDHTYTAFSKTEYTASLSMSSCGTSGASWSGTATVTQISYMAPIEYQTTTYQASIGVSVSCNADGTQSWGLYMNGNLQKAWTSESCVGAFESWAYPETIPDSMQSPISASSGHYRVTVQGNNCVHRNGGCVESGV